MFDLNTLMALAFPITNWRTVLMCNQIAFRASKLGKRIRRRP